MHFTKLDKTRAFQRISGGFTSKVYKSIENNPIVMKKITNYQNYDVYQREKYVLLLLKEHHIPWCPQLISYDDTQQLLVMTDCGEPITKANRPHHVRHAFEQILRDMEALGLQHNDIKQCELLIKDGELFICDFGWASLHNDHGCGQELWHGQKPGGYIKDERALEYVLNKL